MRVKLVAAQPEEVWPAESTIGDVLQRAGRDLTLDSFIASPESMNWKLIT